ncbi:bis(5'-nucleosyl)-tetraphosphatase (symmetrical) YqeK [Anaerosacchariphilus polymeriproducens]|uniref:bis(5'-nucleosyl)-tetraphosphatase (symmetrical) n=1 Tax=Anaerosacchariphilus polymeriproducens TaxID=1812858 RepID=A0A371ATZ5_9FIRM|nr:bis(5'-nucleosyl)-tetraphosphatase (symmetrical) YqeK [Anaerosacchariphilus polymeriproducens]RDU23041.1 HD domain-containing protein [Anaerosacchariphilus polymeriproducens]
MNFNDLYQIENQLEKDLDTERYKHTLGVSYTAASLAMRYDFDIYKAQLAGLLHDCAKCISDSEKILICDREKIVISDFERENPFLIHAKLGAYLASTKYDVKDDEILEAITYHTTGRPNMSILEKIIYIADYIEPQRNKSPNLKKIRKMAFIDIDECLCMILEDCLKFLKGNGKHNIDPMTQKSYNYYLKKLKERTNESINRNGKNCL